MQTFDVLVRGGGQVGRSLALALGHAGLAVALREGATPPSTAADVRAYALNASSVALLSELKVWDAIKAPSITAVHEMRVRGDAAGSMLEFSAWQQHVGALAWIVDAQALDQELDAALRFAPNVTPAQQASLLNVSSMGGFLPVPGQAACGASKAALAPTSRRTLASRFRTWKR